MAKTISSCMLEKRLSMMISKIGNTPACLVEYVSIGLYLHLRKNKSNITMKKLVLLPLTAVLLFTTSCYVNRTTVGNGPVGKIDSKELYGKTKQVYLFWG